MWSCLNKAKEQKHSSICNGIIIQLVDLCAIPLIELLCDSILLVVCSEDVVAKAISNCSDHPVLKLNHEKVSLVEQACLPLMGGKQGCW